MEPDDVVARLRAAFEPAADPERAAGMAAYMRDQLAFFGIPTPLRRRLAKEALAGVAPPTDRQLARVAIALWDEPERELQYVGCDLLRNHVGVAGPGFLAVVATLLRTKAWWDTVDDLAAHTVGPLVRRHPELVAVMDEWIASDHLWTARTAILHQLSYGTDADAERLFRYCRLRATDTNFFIRKAIGWALRQHARVDPGAVDTFVDATPELSPLSVREARKRRRA